MERRDFLKNSLFALFSTAITSNKVLASVAETLTPTSPKVLLYLVETITGDLKVRATKWVDLPTKRLIPSEVKPETFKALEIVNLEDVNKRRLELWKEHNCTGRIGHLLSMGIPMTEEMRKEYGEQAKKNHIGLKRNIETKLKIKESAKKRRKPIEKTLENPKSQIILDLLKNNVGVNEIVRQTKCSHALYYRVKKHYDGGILKIGTNKKSIFSYKNNIFLKEYSSVTDASKELNVSMSCIGRVLNGSIESSKGFIFRYKDTV